MRKASVEVVRLGKRGELVLPRRVRSSLGVREGDELVLTVDDKRLVVEHRARGFSMYLDVMTPRDDEKPVSPRAPAAKRRGLGRFLSR